MILYYCGAFHTDRQTLRRFFISSYFTGEQVGKDKQKKRPGGRQLIKEEVTYIEGEI